MRSLSRLASAPPGRLGCCVQLPREGFRCVASVTGIAFVAVVVGISMVPTFTSAKPSAPRGRTMLGGGSLDLVTSGAGHDLMYRNAGSDAMSGGPADDVLDGGTGGDVLRGLGGDDEAFGGRGIDDCVAETEVDCER
jgi:hypothetical protein